MFNSNIDRFDAQQISKAPFTYESTLEIGDYVLPSGSFPSIRIYAEDTARVPFRFHSIMQDGRISFCDADGNVVAYWHTFDKTKEATTSHKYISSLLLNPNGIIAGHICCTQTAMAIIRSVIADNNDTLFLPSNSLVLLPQCHVSMIGGIGRSFAVHLSDGSIKYCTGNLTLQAAEVEDKKQQIVLVSLDLPQDADDTEHSSGYIGPDSVKSPSEATIKVDLINSENALVKRLVPNGICAVKVDGEPVWTYTDSPDKNTNIIIKAGVLSNLRLSKESNNLIFTGVNNA
jgi:hypothetical protein